ncbi:MAG: hypothetical protein Lokiarch_35470 [Candidatus Lokiarchaeum sp. GC14_75]|nr:MAG: hypothetical protein Lokiarch_35470 [Candidatus Lokiarchaeum sp. GC14_75]
MDYQFIDKEFLEKVFKLDESYDENKEDFILIIENISGSLYKQLNGDINQILLILDKGKSK